MATLTADNISISSDINYATTSSVFIGPIRTKVQNKAISKVETELSLIWERLNFLQRTTPEFVELSCKNCGGKIQQKYQDPIFKCPYCKTVYVIGYRQVNA